MFRIQPLLYDDNQFQRMFNNLIVMRLNRVWYGKILVHRSSITYILLAVVKPHERILFVLSI